MKKIFPFHVPGKAEPRVIDAIKAEIGRYLKRERRKSVPEGMDFWDFDCKVGIDKQTAEPKRMLELGRAIDAVAQTGADSVYVEILAKPGNKPVGESGGLPPRPLP